MKKLISVLLFAIFILASIINVSAQKRQHPNKHRTSAKKVRVYKQSIYRPHRRVKVFHPHWNPIFSYQRRWVYFPRYNIYWDNWRNKYVYLNNNVWITQAAVPQIILNVNLEKEEHQELGEDKDDIDEIYMK